MGISTDKALKQQLIFFTIILMLTGLFVSRALLSVSMIFFLLLTCVHSRAGGQFKNFLREPFLVGLTLLFLIPLLTWFWSEDKEIWWRFIRIKLPLLLLPLAFAGSWQLARKQWNYIGYFFILLVLAGCMWSLFQYATNYKDIHEGYLKAKVIPTPFENDHVRFSLSVTMAILCAGYFLLRDKSYRWAMVSVTVVLVVYLHLLAARTGLISFYIILFLGAIWLLFTARKSKWTIVLLTAALLMPMLAWFTVPTFQNRVRYFIYDFSYIRQDTYLPGANDGNRFLSIRAGLDLMQQHPFGVGTGDVMKEVNRWYDSHVHGMLDTDRIYPSSEWAMQGAAAGWTGFIGFTVIMLLPFFIRFGPGRFFWIALNAIMAFSFIFDIGLEVQFGVFLYAFGVLWWWKWLQEEKTKTLS